MPDRADAHIHLFDGGFGGSFTHRPGVEIDEGELYASLAKDHGVKAALVVGYEEMDWAAGNNAYIARMAERYDWVRPVAFIDPARPPSLDVLEHFREQRFVGLSIYFFTEGKADQLPNVPDDVWAWLVRRRWLVSVNVRPKDLPAWRPILERHNDLRELVSHLGLPPRVGEPPDEGAARQALAPLCELARYPGVRVKLSGFYALTDPGHDYPHRAAWPYVEVLLNTFGPDRLVWGSDCTPCLDWVSFPQTLGLFGRMPFLTPDLRRRIEGENLLALLGEVSTGR